MKEAVRNPRSGYEVRVKRCLILKALELTNVSEGKPSRGSRGTGQRGRLPKHGGVAQLGEHLLCKQGVIGSIPFISTTRRESGKSSREGGKKGSR